MPLPLRLTDPDTALAALLALIPAPVAPRPCPLFQAAGAILAEDLRLERPIPPAAQALRDGWAVAAAETLGAGPYSPVPLPRAEWLETGENLPPGADAILPPFDASAFGPSQAALREVAAGEGVRQPGEEAAAGQLVRAAGERLRLQDLPLLATAGTGEVPVRCPRVALLPAGDELAAEPGLDRLGPWIAGLARAAGAAARLLPPVADDPSAIAAGLGAAAPQADLLLLLGGSGEGRRDRSAAGLAGAGRLLFHGLGACPGFSTALGEVAGRPVILLPGRFEDALAGWLLLGLPALRRLAAAKPEPVRKLRLARKIASTVGLAEVALLGPADAAGTADVLACGSLPLAALSQAEAVLVVPSGAEGYEAGSWVAAWPL